MRVLILPPPHSVFDRPYHSHCPSGEPHRTHHDGTLTRHVYTIIRPRRQGQHGVPPGASYAQPRQPHLPSQHLWFNTKAGGVLRAFLRPLPPRVHRLTSPVARHRRRQQSVRVLQHTQTNSFLLCVPQLPRQVHAHPCHQSRLPQGIPRAHRRPRLSHINVDVASERGRMDQVRQGQRSTKRA
jgi:hypothetical protein